LENRFGNFEIKDLLLLWATLVSPCFPLFTEKFEKKELYIKYNKEDKELFASMDVVRNLYGDVKELLQKLDKSEKDLESLKIIVPAEWEYVFFKKIKEKRSKICYGRN
jgi:hypothetical protein